MSVQNTCFSLAHFHFRLRIVICELTSCDIPIAVHCTPIQHRLSVTWPLSSAHSLHSRKTRSIHKHAGTMLLCDSLPGDVCRSLCEGGAERGERQCRTFTQSQHDGYASSRCTYFGGRWRRVRCGRLWLRCARSVQSSCGLSSLYLPLVIPMSAQCHASGTLGTAVRPPPLYVGARHAESTHVFQPHSRYCHTGILPSCIVCGSAEGQ